MMANTLNLKIKCVKNDGYPASLEIGRVYDGMRLSRGGFGVKDESGEIYAYQESFFEIVDN